jgi:thioesterase domain-containing protein
MNDFIEPSTFGSTVPFVARTGIKAIQLDLDKILLMMPLESNENHVGIMYAGALFTLAETIGGAVGRVYLRMVDAFTIVKGVNIKFTRPAKTDITCEFRMDPNEAKQIVDKCETKGKADFEIHLELKDAGGNVVAMAEGIYQIRKGTTL